MRNAGPLPTDEQIRPENHVYVDEAIFEKLPPMKEDENDLLDGSSHRRPNLRLSCQIKFGPELDGLRVTIAPED